MSPLIYIVPLSLLLLMPPILLGIRFVRRSSMPWWLFLLIVAGFGWLLVNFTVHAYYGYMGDLVKSYSDPPQKLLDELNADGAKLVFALLFGWLYGLFYSVPWLLVYSLIVGVRSIIKPRVAAPAEAKAF
jgi:hypothetical protein